MLPHQWHPECHVEACLARGVAKSRLDVLVLMLNSALTAATVQADLITHSSWLSLAHEKNKNDSVVGSVKQRGVKNFTAVYLQWIGLCSPTQFAFSPTVTTVFQALQFGRTIAAYSTLWAPNQFARNIEASGPHTGA
jgi:hypothetical protein